MSETIFSKLYAAGEEIFHDGDMGRHAYIIESGKVEVSVSTDGKKVVLAKLGEGELFGEMSMIDEAPRSATVMAIEDTEVVVMQRSRFQRPLEMQDPLMNMMLRVLLNRFRNAQNRYTGSIDDASEPDPSLEAARKIALRRLDIEKAMRHGLDAQEFEMHYQPLITLQGGHIAGFEALMRWNKKVGDPSFPDEFIPLAEETGLIVELGRWSLERAIADHITFVASMAARSPELSAPFMSINVSGLQLSEMSEINELARIIRDADIDPALIKLEMTETLLVENPDHAAEALRQLKEYGISIAIDDFGTGYSSLSYLHRFPLDTLKIDREFVTNMDKSESSLRIVNSIAQLALSLDMNIVAEGIEEQAQMDALRELGCQYGQGYLMARPAPYAKTMELLESNPRW